MMKKKRSKKNTTQTARFRSLYACVPHICIIFTNAASCWNIVPWLSVCLCRLYPLCVRKHYTQHTEHATQYKMGVLFGTGVSEHVLVCFWLTGMCARHAFHVGWFSSRALRLSTPGRSLTDLLIYTKYEYAENAHTKREEEEEIMKKERKKNNNCTRSRFTNITNGLLRIAYESVCRFSIFCCMFLVVAVYVPHLCYNAMWMSIAGSSTTTKRIYSFRNKFRIKNTIFTFSYSWVFTCFFFVS